MCKLEFMHQIVDSCYLYLHFHFWFLRDLKNFPPFQFMLNFKPPTWQPSCFSDSLQIYKIGRRTSKETFPQCNDKICHVILEKKTFEISGNQNPLLALMAILNARSKQEKEKQNIPSKFGSNRPSDFRKD